MLPLAGAVADDGQRVDQAFDKTGDQLVDAADWKLMSKDEKIAYATASVSALGEHPDALLPDGASRAEHYLKGLIRVYE